MAYLLVVATCATLVALGLLSARAEGSTCPSGAGWTALSTPPLLVGWSGRGTDISGSMAVYGSEPPTLYLAGPPYGVLRSQDCGATWGTVPSPWPGRPFGQATRTIAVDQAGRIYVLFYGAQLVMSDDGGLTWQSSGNVFYPGGDALGSVPYALAVGTSPNVSGLAYAWIQTRAGRGQQVGARTLNGGEAWQVVERLCVGNWIAVTPDSSVIYAAALGEPSIFQNRIAGDTATCSQLAQFSTGVTSLAMSMDGSNLWVATSGGLYRSRDQGVTWQLHAPQAGSGEWRALAVDPGEPNVLLTLDQNGKVWLYRESDVTPVQSPSQIPG